MRLLLSGYYGFGNLGDEAILSGLVGAFRQRGHEVTVLSGDPAATEVQHDVRAAHRTRGLIGELLRCDALVSGGGGLLQDVTSARSLSYYLTTIRLARLIGKRVAIYGQSLGPLTGDGKRRVARAVRGVPAFWRDEQSRRLARELGLDDRSTADAALLLAPQRPPGPADDGPVLLVPRSGHPDHNQALQRLAGSLIDEGARVTAVALHHGPDDAEVAGLMRAVPGVEVADARSPAHLLELLAGVRFVVSARLHGCILAAAAGVPFAALSYDPKVEGFAERVGAPVFHAPVDASALLEATKEPAPLDPSRRAELVTEADVGIDELFSALAA